MQVNGRSRWHGSFREGDGTISTASDTLREVPYTYASRFEGAPGACPEELVAAAHAACVNHAIANIFRMNDLALDSVETSADLAMGQDERGFPAILGVHFRITARAPDVALDDFRRYADMATNGCAISKALQVPLTHEATLTGWASSSQGSVTDQ